MFPCELLINVGFIAAQMVIQAQAMRGVAGAVSIPQWIVILAVPAVVIGIFGYRWIHRVMQATAVPVTCPPGRAGGGLFWAVYAGNVLATAGSCAVGAYLAALLPGLGPVAAIGMVSGSWALVSWRSA